MSYDKAQVRVNNAITELEVAISELDAEMQQLEHAVIGAGLDIDQDIEDNRVDRYWDLEATASNIEACKLELQDVL